jgi:hypothetical protein
MFENSTVTAPVCVITTSAGAPVVRKLLTMVAETEAITE